MQTINSHKLFTLLRNIDEVFRFQKNRRPSCGTAELSAKSINSMPKFSLNFQLLEIQLTFSFLIRFISSLTDCTSGLEFSGKTPTSSCNLNTRARYCISRPWAKLSFMMGKVRHLLNWPLSLRRVASTEGSLWGLKQVITVVLKLPLKSSINSCDNLESLSIRPSHVGTVSLRTIWPHSSYPWSKTRSGFCSLAMLPASLATAKRPLFRVGPSLRRSSWTSCINFSAAGKSTKTSLEVFGAGLSLVT